jgi:hypothetical protein
MALEREPTPPYGEKPLSSVNVFCHRDLSLVECRGFGRKVAWPRWRCFTFLVRPPVSSAHRRLFGDTVVLEIARSGANVAGMVSFHGRPGHAERGGGQGQKRLRPQDSASEEGGRSQVLTYLFYASPPREVKC